jgi:hypothetical protein
MPVAFDTLKFAQALRDKAHVPQDQAEGMAQAFAEATGEQIATKGDLNELALRLEAKISEAKADTVKWMFGQTLVTIGVIATLLRFSH